MSHERRKHRARSMVVIRLKTSAMSNTKPYCFSRSLAAPESLEQNGFLVSNSNRRRNFSSLQIRCSYTQKKTNKQTNKQTNNKTKQKQNKQNHAKKKEKREKKCKIRLGSIDKLDELLLYLVYEFIGDDRHRTILFTIAIYKNFEKATQVLF